MATVSFTPNLQRHVECESLTVNASTVIEALNAAFQSNPAVKSYVVDERMQLRHHIVVFLNGVPIQDRENMTDAVADSDEVFVFQALSGG
ncbi:MAG: MoaD/ThiS family protein [Planctomycetota bacterium]